jgi:hypothetical protein
MPEQQKNGRSHVTGDYYYRLFTAADVATMSAVARFFAVFFTV